MHGNPQTSWKAALPDMERAGFEFLGEELIYPRLYCQLFRFEAEPGIKRLKVHARTYQPTHRYPEGISIGLIRAVDGFVFWFERERILFVIPTDWLRAVIVECMPLVVKGQLLCNLRVRDRVLEVINGDQRDIGAFCVQIPVI